MSKFQDAVYSLLKLNRKIKEDVNKFEEIPRNAFDKKVAPPIDLRTEITPELVLMIERDLNYKYQENLSDPDKLVFLNLLFDEREADDIHDAINIPPNQNQAQAVDFMEKYRHPKPLPPNKNN